MPPKHRHNHQQQQRTGDPRLDFGSGPSSDGNGRGRGRGRGRGAGGARGRGRGGGRGGLGSALAHAGFGAPAGFDTQLLAQFTSGVNVSAPRGGFGSAAGSGTASPRGRGRGAGGVGRGRGAGGYGRGGALAVQGANAVQFDYADLNARSAARARESAARREREAAEAGEDESEGEEHEEQDPWAGVPSDSDEDDSGAGAGLQPSSGADSDDSAGNAVLEPHRRYTHVRKPHLEVERPVSPPPGAALHQTAASEQERADHALALELQARESAGAVVVGPRGKARYQRHATPTSFPAFYTSRPAVDEAEAAAAAADARKGGVKKLANGKIRPAEQEGDARYLAGIPPAYRAQLGLPPAGGAGRGGGGGRFAGASPFIARLAAGIDADDGRARLQTPVAFRKAEGEWKDGAWVRLGEAGAQQAEAADAASGAADGKDMSKGKGKGKARAADGDDAEARAAALELAQRAEADGLRLTSRAGKPHGAHGAGLGFRAPAAALAPDEPAHGGQDSDFGLERRQLQEIDLDKLVSDVLGTGTGSASGLVPGQAASGIAQQPHSVFDHLLSAFPGSQTLPASADQRVDLTDYTPAPSNGQVQREDAMEEDDEEDDDDEVILIPQQAQVHASAGPGAQHGWQAGESDSEEERQLDAIIAEAAAQRAQSAAEGAGAPAPLTNGKPSAAEPIVIDIDTDDDLHEEKAEEHKETAAESDSREDADFFVMDTTGDAPGVETAEAPAYDRGPVLGEQSVASTTSVTARKDGHTVTVIEETITATAAAPAQDSSAAKAAEKIAPASIWNANNRQPRGEGKKARNAAKKARRRERQKAAAQEPGADLAAKQQRKPRVGDSDIEWGSDGPPGADEDASDEDEEIHPATDPTFRQRLGVEASASASSASPAEAPVSAVAARKAKLLKAPLDPNEDADEEVTLDAMKRFLHGMSAGGSREMTLHDIEDDKLLQEEADWMTTSDEGSGDEDGAAAPPDAEVKAKTVDRAIRMTEEEMLDESASSDEEDDSSDEDDDAIVIAIEEDDDDDDDSEDDSDDDGDMFNGRSAWDVSNDDFIKAMSKLTDDNADVIFGRDRKARKELFRQIERGDFGDLVDDDIEIDLDDPVFGLGSVPAAKKNKDRGKKIKEDDLWAEELQAQWNKDRAAKATKKQQRAAERQAAAANPFPNTHGKGKKAAKKEAKRARRNARARGEVDSDSDEDMGGGANGLRQAQNLNELNAHIQIFLGDAGKDTMALPPMDKRSRAQVHMLADAYSLKSKSRGSGKQRFPVLIKVARSGIEVDHKRVSRILSGHVGMWGIGSAAAARGKGKGAKTVGHTGGGAHAPRNREGAEVGWGADKIGADNIGHRLLSMMGWKEGAGIGQAGGIAEPVGATVKITRGGLGF